jgi:hypothetical protein
VSDSLVLPDVRQVIIRTLSDRQFVVANYSAGLLSPHGC